MKLQDALDWIKQKNQDKEQVDFSIKFIKKDNTIRVMNCRTAVTDILVNNPTRPGTDFAKHGLVSVYEVESNQYKSFSKDKLLYIKIADVWTPIDENQLVILSGP